jgi:hypothetical protein
VYGITLSKTLGDHMILQRDVAALVWGFDTPGNIGTLLIGAFSEYRMFFHSHVYLSHNPVSIEELDRDH